MRHSKGTPACSPELSLPGRGGEAGSRAARARAGRTRPSASLNKERADGSLLSAGSRGRLTPLPWLLKPGWVFFLLVFCLFNIYFWLQWFELQHAGSLLWHVGLPSSGGMRTSSCCAWSSLPHGMRDLHSRTRGGTCVPCMSRQTLATGPPGKALGSTCLCRCRKRADRGGSRSKR